MTIVDIILVTLAGAVRRSAACLLAVGVLAAPATAATAAADGWPGGGSEFLPVDEAFDLSVERGPDGAVVARWEMPEGYYLYRHRFEFDTRAADGDGASPVALGEPEVPPGEPKVDEYFGEVEVFYDAVRARVPVASGSGSVDVGVTYQGCADAGLCYPPETRWVTLDLGTAGADGVGGAAAGTASPSVPAGEERDLAAALGGSNLALALGMFFIGGMALAFTPCVLPMVPILSSVIVGEAGRVTRGRAVTLSVAYVLGMATTYAAVGTMVGLFGASVNLQAALQAPPVIIAFAAAFVLLSLSMFGFYELRLPQAWQTRLDAIGGRAGGGKHLGVAVMGALSAVVVSPCVSAPLAGALIYLSTTGDALLGGSALLALGLGMGVPLLVVGASGGHLLPRAGAWMNGIKAVFGVGLLAVAVWLLERLLPAAATLALWAALAMGVGVYLGALELAPRAGLRQLQKAGGAFSFIYGVLLLIGAASGAEDPLEPLAPLGSETAPAAAEAPPAAAEAPAAQWRSVATLGELRAELDRAAAAGRPAMLDLYADWCISCKVMERTVFPAPEVDQRLRRFHLLRADVTDHDAEDRALMEALGLFGPPSLAFFAEGEALSGATIQGEVGVERLAAHLQGVLDRAGGAPADSIESNELASN
ncbi:MAG: protein-disulfide reductase DsbD [Pseudomonadota bacterium]